MTTQDTADKWIEAGIDSECVRHIVREWSTCKDAAGTLLGIDTTEDDWPEELIQRIKALKESDRTWRDLACRITRSNCVKGCA